MHCYANNKLLSYQYNVLWPFVNKPVDHTCNQSSARPLSSCKQVIAVVYSLPPYSLYHCVHKQEVMGGMCCPRNTAVVPKLSNYFTWRFPTTYFFDLGSLGGTNICYDKHSFMENKYQQSYTSGPAYRF